MLFITDQIHDEVELDGQIHNEENAWPTILGICWHHHIWKTREEKRWKNWGLYRWIVYYESFSKHFLIEIDYYYIFNSDSLTVATCG